MGGGAWEAAASGVTDRQVVTRLARTQDGEIQLETFAEWPLFSHETYRFRASSDGHVRLEVTIPLDIQAGDRTVSICWSGACHAQTTLHVAARQVGPSASP